MITSLNKTQHFELTTKSCLSYIFGEEILLSFTQEIRGLLLRKLRFD